MITVLFLIPTLDRGGAENVLVDLVNNMDQTKFKITVQTLFNKNAQKDRLRAGIEYKTFLYHQFRGNSRLMARISPKLLYKLIVKKQYDVVISYLEGPTTHIISGCPYVNTKLVAWIHVEMNSVKQAAAGFKSLSEAVRAYEGFDKVVFVADTVRRSFQSLTERTFLNSCVLYNTIDSQKIMLKAEEAIVNGLFRKDEFNIISIGRIIPAKGFDRLVNIQKKLHDFGYNTHIYILGTGKEYEIIHTKVTMNGIEDSFTFLGFKDNPYKYLVKADLYVCSSRREGFSTAVTEALILGVPVVSTNCSGAYELLGNNNEYGVVTDNNEDSLYMGIQQLLEDPNLLIHYRNQAFKRGLKFDAAETVKAAEEMISDL